MINTSNVKKYCYYSKDNSLAYIKIRTDYSDGRKTFIFQKPNGTNGLQGQKHLLYNLPDVLKGDPVYFVEGEKCADALIELGYVATTLDSGANSKWQPEFTDILKNKTVIIIPDNDKPGMKYARTIKRNIPTAIIKELPGLNEKEDIFDWLEKGYSVSEIERFPETILDNPELDDNDDLENESGCSHDKMTQTEILIQAIKEEKIELFLNEENDSYAEISFANHKELLSLDSTNFSLWAQRLYFKKTGKTIRQEGLKQVINILKAETTFENKDCITLYNRVAEHANDFWYDLTNQSWEAVKISKDGWSVESNTPKLFYRYRHQQAQVLPKAEGDITKIFKYINLNRYKTLFICWLVSCFVPNIPHPMPIFYGEKGAAKSTACVLLKKLIDPSVLETLSMSKEEKSLVLNLKQHYYLPFDNVSAISNDTSDILCRAITGGALQFRKLFTDAEDYIFTFKRCLTINGINNVANRADLLDRSLLLELDRVTQDNRKNLQEVYSSFEEDRPYLLGSIFDLLSKAMSIFPTVNLSKLPRMADFCRWGYAIGEAMGGKGTEFLEEYNHNQSIQNVEAIHADTCAFLIVEYMRNRDTWIGRVSELFKDLQKEAEKHGLNPKNKTTIPQAPNALSRRIKAVKSNLEAVGIDIEFDNDNNADGKYIYLTNKKSSPLPSYRVNSADILGVSNADNGDNGDNFDNIEF